MDKKIKMHILDMTCAACSQKVENELNKLDSVKNANVNLSTEKATINYDSSKVKPSELVETVKNTGYGVKEETIELEIEDMT